MEIIENKSIIYYDTKYGKIAIPINDQYFIDVFNSGLYWEQDEIDYNLSLIDKSKNILEFGSHVGTHTIPYASFLNNDCIVYSFEPQKYIYDILKINIHNNKLDDKIIATNGGLFFYDGLINLNNQFLDGSFLGDVNEAKDSLVDCNFGGLSIGDSGEEVHCYKIDNLKLDNLGFIHADAQGSEPYIFWGARETIKKYMPIIFYEDESIDLNNNIKNNGNIFKESILKKFDCDEEVYNFNVDDFCRELGYKNIIKGHNTYLIP